MNYHPGLGSDEVSTAEQADLEFRVEGIALIDAERSEDARGNVAGIINDSTPLPPSDVFHNPTLTLIPTDSPLTPQPAPSFSKEGPAPLDKKITLLKRPAHKINEDASRRAASYGVASLGSLLEAVQYRQTGSEPSLTLLHSVTPTPSTSRPTSPFTPSSPSLAENPSVSCSEDDGMMTEQEEVEEGGMPTLDPIVIAAMSTPRDRALLLRAEIEMERFLFDPTMSRLPLSPPYFPPQLNSYQRLLIHRLADTYGIRREVEAAPVNWTNPSSGTSSGIVILVKGVGARVPPLSLSLLAPLPPPTLPTTSIPSIPLAPLVLSPTPVLLPPTATILPPAYLSAPPSPKIASSSSVPLVAASPMTQQLFKILPRVSRRSASTASSSTGADDDGSMRRKEMTLEEREAAYKEARERIFSGSEINDAAEVATPTTIIRPASTDSAYSRASAAPPSISPSPILYSGFPPPSHQGAPGMVYYSHPTSIAHPAGPMGMSGGPVHLRPSAPSFNPNQGGWSSYSYATTSYQNGNLVAQESVYGENHSQYGGGHSYSSTTEGTTYSTHPPPQSSTTRYVNHQQQPPIQITAPSPLPQYAHRLQQFQHPPPPPPPLSQFVNPNQSRPIPPPPPSVAWSQIPLSSPSLSTSSGGSSYRQSAPSISSTTKSGDRVGGYIMRYPDGAVIYPGGERKGGAGRTPPRSVSSVSTTSSSTSRTASSSNLRAYATSSSHAGSSPSAEKGRRVHHSNSTSLSSSSAAVSAHGPSSSPSASASGSIGRPSRSRSIGTSTSTSGSGGSIGGSDSGRGSGSTKSILETTRNHKSLEPDVKDGESKRTMLHPSLPAKPTWSSSSGPTISEQRPGIIRAHSAAPALTRRGSAIPPPPRNFNSPLNAPSPSTYISRSPIPNTSYPHGSHPSASYPQQQQYHQNQQPPSTPQWWDPSSQPVHSLDPYTPYSNYLNPGHIDGNTDRRAGNRSMELFDPKSSVSNGGGSA